MVVHRCQLAVSKAKDGKVGKASFDTTMDLRVKEGAYQGKNIPPMSEYVDDSLIEEAKKQLGIK